MRVGIQIKQGNVKPRTLKAIEPMSSDKMRVILGPEPGVDNGLTFVAKKTYLGVTGIVFWSDE